MALYVQDLIKKQEERILIICGQLTKYLVIECKTEATTQTIKKDYCNQLSGSVNWFKENYVYPK